MNPYQFQYGYNPYNSQMLNGKIVVSQENITVNDVPMDGTLAFFPKNDYSEIYAKSWGCDGKIRTIVFKPILDVGVDKLSPNEEKSKIDPLENVTELFEKKFDDVISRLEQLEQKLAPKTRSKGAE